LARVVSEIVASSMEHRRCFCGGRNILATYRKTCS
jgi:hypothetical protein